MNLMNRRSFINSLVGLGIAATLDVNRMLWIPGEKKIFIPHFTESQRSQWINFLQSRDEWLNLISRGLIWPGTDNQEVLKKIAEGERRAKELGLDEKLHRIIPSVEFDDE